MFTRWGNPGNRVSFLASLRTGSTPVPGCTGTTVSLMNPTLMGYGTAYFQAVDQPACRVSNLVSEPL